jgi:alkanesulfonate monooxygenase SsuD/methylene tetrahydromethanopterin reductase-like flavin-dependent oxidoreductase (luciferase family)
MVEVFAFHLMPYTDLPIDALDKHGTSWVKLPNSYYDPVKGREFYNQYFEQLEYSDRLGFDGVVVNEHHQTAYGLMPAPNVIAGLLAGRIKKAKIAILGNAIAMHAIPQRIAEEIAILDVATGGRIISGFVRGIGAEYFSFRNVNPSDSKERFYEAHDIIMRAWTETGPFEYHGKHYHFPYINTWPRPFHQPHPPIFLPSQGSTDTIEFGAKHRYTYLQTLSSTDAMKKSFDLFREEAEKNGYTASPSQLGWSHKVYVAETDAKAWEEAEEHMAFFFERLLNMPPEMFFPPGYLHEASMRQILSNAKSRKNRTMQEMCDMGLITIGSEATVRQRLCELQKEMGFGVLNAHMHTGNMPHWKAMKNIDLFGRFVLPHLQKLGEPEAAAESDKTCPQSLSKPAMGGAL